MRLLKERLCDVIAIKVGRVLSHSSRLVVIRCVSYRGKWPNFRGPKSLIHFYCLTFAMTGALAWQVTIFLNKILDFLGFWEGDRTGFCPGSLPLCGALSSSVSRSFVCFCYSHPSILILHIWIWYTDNPSK